ncbi:MAG: 2-C-methyl-D-erythritol 4-phosphate cytidylyltransferase [Bacteroidaceae bacterium]
MNSHRHIALLLAGGSGIRMKATLPKQYMQVDGESVLLHTMRAFQQHPLIQDIYVVCADEWADYVREEADKGGIDKFRSTFRGGVTGYESLCNGIRQLTCMVDEPDALVMVHDAVRPLVTQDVISRNIAVCLTHGNAITGLGSHEAFMISPDGRVSTEFLPREGVLRAQTPHTFPLKVMGEIIEKAKEQGITHSQSLFTLANETGFQPLYIAEGDPINFKITTPRDLLLYQAIKDTKL